MLRNVLFDMELFATDTDADKENSQQRVLFLLQALVNCNRLYLRNHPDTPLLYRSGVVYTTPEPMMKGDLPEVKPVRDYLNSKSAPQAIQDALSDLSDQCGSGEHFREIPRIIGNNGGDCDNLASWRAAELNELGIAAKPYITWRVRPDGGTTYHVIVRWPDGSSEDPSLLLGMGGASREADRQNELRKLNERQAILMNSITSNQDAIAALSDPTNLVAPAPKLNMSQDQLEDILGVIGASFRRTGSAKLRSRKGRY